jgi:hypothetical protein
VGRNISHDLAVLSKILSIPAVDSSGIHFTGDLPILEDEA